LINPKTNPFSPQPPAAGPVFASSIAANYQGHPFSGTASPSPLKKELNPTFPFESLEKARQNFPWAWDSCFISQDLSFVPQLGRVEDELSRFSQQDVSLKKMLKSWLGYLLYSNTASQALNSTQLQTFRISPLNLFAGYFQAPSLRLAFTHHQSQEALIFTTALYIAEALQLSLDQCIETTYRSRNEWGLVAFENSLPASVLSSSITPTSGEVFLSTALYYTLSRSFFLASSWAVLCSPNFCQEFPKLGQVIKHVYRCVHQQYCFGLKFASQITHFESPQNIPLVQEEYVETVKVALTLESQWTHYILPQETFGISSRSVVQYLKFLTDQAFKSIGAQPQFKVGVPYPWEPFTL